MLKEALKGLSWTSLSAITRGIVGLLQISILTNILSKADFGIIAIAVLFIGFTQIFQDMGISIAILHKQNITKKQYSSLFWLNIILGTFLTIILAALSPLISNYYDNEQLKPIIIILSLTIFFAAIGNQHKTVQQKELRFKYIAIIECITAILTLLVAILLAYNDFGVYSLVYSTLFNSMFLNILFLILGLKNDKNISFYFSFRETKDFLKIGVFNIGSNTLDYVSREADIFIIGKTFGNEVLGVYSLCKKLAITSFIIITPIITRILTPLLSKIQSNTQQVASVYLKIVETLSVINTPIFFLLAIFSSSILNFIYGQQYIIGNFYLTIMALQYSLVSLSSPVGSLQVALGRTDLGFYWTVYRVLITIIVIYIGSLFNIDILIILMLLMAILNFFVVWRLQIYTMIKVTLLNYLKSMIFPFFQLTILSLPLFIFFYKTTSLFIIIPLGITYIILYIVINLFFNKNIYLISVVKNIFAKKNNL